MVVRYYSSTAAETQLTGTISPTALSINVLDVTGFPVSYPYTLALDYESASEELVDVTAAAGGTLTVVRAVDGTSATSHSTGARVRHVSSARDFRDSRNHENSVDGVHGVTGDVVGDSDTQTLSNKTLDSPAFTGAFTGTLTGSVTSRIRIPNSTNASPTSTNHALQIGPDSAINLRFGDNEIVSANNGVPAGLAIQPDGGVTQFNGLVAADNSGTSVIINGTANINRIILARAVATGQVLQVKASADTVPRLACRADGRLDWGPGTSAADASLYRASAGLLEIQSNLNVTNSITSSNVVTDDVTTDTLNVSTNVVMPKTVATGATVAVAQTGWSLSSAQHVSTAGVCTLQVTVTRTGAGIVANAAGNITDTPMVQINGFALPNSNLSDLHGSASNAVGVGAIYMDGSGIITIQSWMPSQTIATGDNISCYFTYVQ